MIHSSTFHNWMVSCSWLLASLLFACLTGIIRRSIAQYGHILLIIDIRPFKTQKIRLHLLY
ncbi:hypothetical protein BABINDRAFT_71105 [Babjeviella inositovora NRRL Y-12698]|uniref:Uncharacterized protein n=1 Tax=Babjeviella inositovora NRRL Y-12698 TaxID=984486 RepID=A0A1E3QXI3_9ASCO|nr:uncharacterized protein BABINDRAFT_71105 [Babjeviella inositovora NRRL Y-12698]ODQ82366.1 hypothetical protein BABINDRAFT_71105 [Babjeviella inositovora NRRL Y-12698]